MNTIYSIFFKKLAFVIRQQLLYNRSTNYEYKTTIQFNEKNDYVR